MMFVLCPFWNRLTSVRWNFLISVLLCVVVFSCVVTQDSEAQKEEFLIKSAKVIEAAPNVLRRVQSITGAGLPEEYQERQSIDPAPLPATPGTSTAMDILENLATPSQSTYAEDSQHDSYEPLSIECTVEIEEAPIAPTPSASVETASVETPKPPRKTSLRESLLMFRKKSKKSTAPSAAARTATCFELEHRKTMEYMRRADERKEAEHTKKMEYMMKDDERKEAEHQLHMQLLKAKLYKIKNSATKRIRSSCSLVL